MSTPPERGQPVRRPVLEPTYVMRRRRTEALAELVREFRDQGQNHNQVEGQDQGRGQSEGQGQGQGQGYEQDRAGGENFESIVVPRAPTAAEDATQELPPVPRSPRSPGIPRIAEAFGHESRGVRDPKGPAERAGRRERPARPEDDGLTLRRAVITVGVTAAALIGVGAALLLPGAAGAGGSQGAAHPPLSPPVSSAAASTPARQGTDPDGAGTLREGDSGPEVTALQQRLLHIPNVYDSGSTSGQYDATLTEAVARFQLWYGIRGDETGVYGDDTRRDLESRTTL
ncbi:peptidoglycan-binding domain-containing protein [Streptomyces avermitilis]|uniref:peptidoglycan-binding domain-containing protein n=1 Tax=Streptomyces avermitilis TaxID=33903 RepID=UPI0033BA838C